MTTDEPRGRWENRCEYAWLLDRGLMTRARILVCDRPDAHAGLHTGRIFSFGLADNLTTSVIGYARRPQ